MARPLPPPPLLVVGPLKKITFYCGFPNISRKRFNLSKKHAVGWWAEETLEQGKLPRSHLRQEGRRQTQGENWGEDIVQ